MTEEGGERERGESRVIEEGGEIYIEKENLEGLN